MVVLRRPHLVLSDVGDNQGVALGGAPQIVDHVGGVEMTVVGQVLDVAHGRIAAVFVDARQPVGAVLGLQVRQELLQVRRRSPIRARSTLTFLLISEASISKWIFLASGA